MSLVVLGHKACNESLGLVICVKLHFSNVFPFVFPLVRFIQTIVANFERKTNCKKKPKNSVKRIDGVKSNAKKKFRKKKPRFGVLLKRQLA
jgi:hypothetical protein